MNDKERKDLMLACKDTKLALERAKGKLENATLEYLYAIDRHNQTIFDYLDEIEKLLEAAYNKHE